MPTTIANNRHVPYDHRRGPFDHRVGDPNRLPWGEPLASSDMSSQLQSQPATLPPELWERVFLHLVPQQILNLRAALLCLVLSMSASVYL